MLSYIVRRILATLPVMGVVVLFVFLLVRIAPGDPAAIIAGDYATPETIQKIRVGLGLDKPVHVQFGIYVMNLLQGDLGRSLHSQLPVRRLIEQRLEPTLALAVSTRTAPAPGGVTATDRCDGAQQSDLGRGADCRRATPEAWPSGLTAHGPPLHGLGGRRGRAWGRQPAVGHFRPQSRPGCRRL
jgi:hypothetical protein